MTAFYREQRHTLATCIFTLILSVSASFTNAESKPWTLQKESSNINFVTIKNSTIGETHHFTDFSGSIAKGMAKVTIKPDSVSSNIDIRNERMREFLFETKMYPTIDITANVADLIKNIQPGISSQSIAAKLSLHGVTKDIQIQAAVSVIGNQIRVSSAEAIIISATDFAMGDGIKKLAELAGVEIVWSVPVNVDLLFTQK